MKTESKYFFCYNKKVADFLRTQGIEYITVAQEPKSQKLFSLYEINEEFQKALALYKQS